MSKKAMRVEREVRGVALAAALASPTPSSRAAALEGLGALSGLTLTLPLPLTSSWSKLNFLT